MARFGFSHQGRHDAALMFQVVYLIIIIVHHTRLLNLHHLFTAPAKGPSNVVNITMVVQSTTFPDPLFESFQK